MPKLNCTYWSDPLCIWAFVAQAKLDRLLAEHADDIDVDYRVVPVFGSVPRRFRDGAWAKAGPAGRAESTRGVASRFGHDEVTGQVWLDDPPASSWAPGCAVKAVFGMESAEACDAGAAETYQRRLREAFFVDNRNTALRDVQLQVAEACAVPVDELRRRLDDGSALAALYEDHEDRQRLLIRGSPTYVFDDGRTMLYGNASEGVLRATVDELLRGDGAGCTDCT